MPLPLSALLCSADCVGLSYLARGHWQHRTKQPALALHVLAKHELLLLLNHTGSLHALVEPCMPLLLSALLCSADCL